MMLGVEEALAKMMKLARERERERWREGEARVPADVCTFRRLANSPASDSPDFWGSRLPRSQSRLERRQQAP